MENIIDFVDWCGTENLALPVPLDVIEQLPPEEQPKQHVDENRKRTGAKEGLYPPQYFGGQYPDLWKIPAAADAAYYQKYKK